MSHSSGGDSYRFHVESDGEELFYTVFRELVLPDLTQRITHVTNQGSMLTLHWTEPRTLSAHALPFPLGVEAVIPMAWEWLRAVEYGEKPDTDGSAKRGWCIKSEDEWHITATIQPKWMIYGK